MTGRNVIPECIYQESKCLRANASGCLIKDFRHDEKRSSPRESFTSFSLALEGRGLG